MSKRLARRSNCVNTISIKFWLFNLDRNSIFKVKTGFGRPFAVQRNHQLKCLSQFLPHSLHGAHPRLQSLFTRYYQAGKTVKRLPIRNVHSYQTSKSSKFSFSVAQNWKSTISLHHFLHKLTIVLTWVTDAVIYGKGFFPNFFYFPAINNRVEGRIRVNNNRGYVFGQDQCTAVECY